MSREGRIFLKVGCMDSSLFNGHGRSKQGRSAGPNYGPATSRQQSGIEYFIGRNAHRQRLQPAYSTYSILLSSTTFFQRTSSSATFLWKASGALKTGVRPCVSMAFATSGALLTLSSSAF